MSTETVRYVDTPVELEINGRRCQYAPMRMEWSFDPEGHPLEGTHDGRFHAPYWMEAPLWQAAGIPALVCGPSGGGLHAADEWVDLRQVQRYAVAVTSAVEAWAVDGAD